MNRWLVLIGIIVWAIFALFGWALCQAAARGNEPIFPPGDPRNN